MTGYNEIHDIVTTNQQKIQLEHLTSVSVEQILHDLVAGPRRRRDHGRDLTYQRSMTMTNPPKLRRSSLHKRRMQQSRPISTETLTRFNRHKNPHASMV